MIYARNTNTSNNVYTEIQFIFWQAKVQVIFVNAHDYYTCTYSIYKGLDGFAFSAGTWVNETTNQPSLIL